MGLPSLYPLGETRAKRRIFEDPTRTIGVREHVPSDGFRHIHWKASARHRNLQVKVFEPTTTLKVILFLAVDSFQHDGVSSEDDFELGISAVASVANHIVQQRSPVGLFVNTCLADSGQTVKILPGSGLNQLVNILEALAKAVLVPSSSFEEFLQEERSSLPWGATLVLVISKPSKPFEGLLASLKEAGYKLLVLQIGEYGRNGVDDTIAWYNIRQPSELIGFGSGEVR